MAVTLYRHGREVNPRSGFGSYVVNYGVIYYDYYEVKQERAQGGCLGTESRRKT